jgi:hypothetical protein
MRGLGRSGEVTRPAASHRSQETSRTAAPADAGTFRWGIVLVSFKRLLASAWLAQALMYWIAVLGPSESVLDRASVQWAAATVFFAVLDPVAAVGLWLATPWGGVIWLFAVMSQSVVAVAIPGFVSRLWIGIDASLVGLYFLLTWLAARSRRSRA